MYIYFICLKRKCIYVGRKNCNNCAVVINIELYNYILDYSVVANYITIL